MRLFPLIYFAVYFAAAFFLPTFRVWKRTGRNPLVFGKSDNALDYIGKVFKLLMAGVFLAVLLNAIFPDFRLYLLPVYRLESWETQAAGVALLVISLSWTVLAQIQMGNSWRIGVDREMKTKLVRSGVFRLSRNPIFLGMVATLFGLFFTFPNAFTLLVLILGFVLIQIQVRLEEDFLTSIHEADYAEYSRQVRRWL